MHLQESNEKLQSKLACQQEWADRDDYIGGLQQEIQFLKHAVDQAKYDKEQLSEELARVTEEMVARSMHDMEEMNRSMQCHAVVRTRDVGAQAQLQRVIGCLTVVHSSWSIVHGP